MRGVVGGGLMLLVFGIWVKRLTGSSGVAGLVMLFGAFGGSTVARMRLKEAPTTTRGDAELAARTDRWPRPHPDRARSAPDADGLRARLGAGVGAILGGCRWPA